MAFWDINYDFLGRQLLPVRQRKERAKAWIKVLLSPIVWLYNRYMANRAANLYHLGITSQVCYMEKVLNDTFDNVDRRIRIVDGVSEEITHVYLDAELRPVYVALDSELPVSAYDAPIWIYTDIETEESGWQFVVEYPTGLVFDMVRLRALVDRYRLPSKSTYLVRSY
jgi:hypothetical protein